MSEAARLTRGSIRSHLLGQALPMAVGVAALMSVGLVDAYFIGQLGSTELAAISFVFPVTIVLSSLGVGVMVGINSVVARSLGSGEGEVAHRRASFGIVFALTLGIAMGLVLFALAEPLFRLMQADEEVLPLALAYFRPFVLGFPLLMAIMGANGVLRGQGEARKTSLVSVSYAAANWLLDPILITGAPEFLFGGFAGFGIAGAAWATIIGWTTGIVVALLLLSRTALPFAPRRAFRDRPGESMKSILGVAGPAAFSNAINPIGLSVLTALLAMEGQEAVAGFGAAGRLQSFAVVPLLALSGAIGAIVGQNWGAGRVDRSRRAMLEAGVFCVGYGILLAAVLTAFSRWFASLFTSDPLVIEQFVSYLEIAAWGYAGYGVLIVANGALNAVGKARLALAQSFARVFLVMMPFAWLMRGSWGPEAIYAAELAANVLGGILAALVVWRALQTGRESAPAKGAAPLTNS